MHSSFAHQAWKGYLGDSCAWTRECGTDGCKDRHHRLLHEKKVAPGSLEGKADTSVSEENKSSTYETEQEHAQRSIALRTVPILKHGDRRLQVNSFLNELKAVIRRILMRMWWRNWSWMVLKKT